MPAEHRGQGKALLPLCYDGSDEQKKGGKRSTVLSVILSLAAAAVLAAIDQLIKRWVTAVLLPVGQMPFLPGIVELRYVLNDGCAFSMLSGRQGVLIAFTSVALAGVLIWLCNKKLPLVERIAWTLVFAGGVGNLIDRVRWRQVVDYLNLLFMDFAVFNFADVCVTAGVGFLILALLLDWRKAAKAAKAEKPAGGEPGQ